MEVQANYIKRIEIHGLWHRYDIAWDLRPDVNILSGINGVGKTTILNRSVNYLEQTSGEVKSDEKNGVHVYFDNSAATFIPYDVIRSYDRPLYHGRLYSTHGRCQREVGTGLAALSAPAPLSGLSGEHRQQDDRTAQR